MARARKEHESRAPTSTSPPRRPKIPRIAQLARRLGRLIPEEELRRVPKDLSSQIDHYVYGTPKR